MKQWKIRCLLSTLSQHVSGIIMPIFRRTKTVCYCMRCVAMVLLDVVDSGCGALLDSVTQTVTFTVLAPYNAAPHNRYQPHPAQTAQHTTCSNTRLGLPKMGTMMTETCWESVDNKHLTVASCWFSLSLHNLLRMHGHRNLKLANICTTCYEIKIYTFCPGAVAPTCLRDSRHELLFCPQT